jgi:hypothetical protein
LLALLRCFIYRRLICKVQGRGSAPCSRFGALVLASLPVFELKHIWSDHLDSGDIALMTDLVKDGTLIGPHLAF